MTKGATIVDVLMSAEWSQWWFASLGLNIQELSHKWFDFSPFSFILEFYSSIVIISLIHTNRSSFLFADVAGSRP